MAQAPASSAIAAVPSRPRPGRLAWVPVGVLGALLAAAMALQVPVTFDPPWLLTPLNFVFLTVVPVVTAVLAVAAYRRTGVATLLALGAGVLATALGSGIVPAVLLFSAGPNATVTIHNGAALLAAACHGLAAVGGVLGLALGARRGRHVAVAYGVVVAAIAALVALTLAGALPTFWADGATPIRQTVLRVAIVLLAVSAFGWWQVAVRDRQIRFLRWYVPALALFALGLVGVMMQLSVGGPVGWLGRIGQYLAAVYMLVAVLPETRVRADDDAAAGTLGVALLQASLPFRPLVESSTDAVVAFGRSGRIVYWNAAAHRLFGHDTAAAFDADPVDLLAPPAATATERARLRAMLGSPSGATGGAPEHVTLARRDGTTVPVDLTVFASPDDNRLVVCVMRDVTERVRAREELEARVRERTADLEQANRAKDEFLSLVSHELRTPITTILAAGSLLDRSVGDADPHGLAADVVAEASRLAGIVDNLLSLARLDTGRGGDPEPIVLDRLLDAAVASARRRNPDRPIERGGDHGVIVEANEAQLLMVLDNYLGNALKYSPPGAPVEVDLVAADGIARVTVRDRGIGVDEDDVEALFEPFWRGAGAGPVPGIGIGLTVCRRIIESLGGSVAAAPRRDGPGAAFSFSLPLLDTGPDDPDDGPRPGASR